MRISDWSSDVCSSDLLHSDVDAACIAHIARRFHGADRLAPRKRGGKRVHQFGKSLISTVFAYQDFEIPICGCLQRAKTALNVGQVAETDNDDGNMQSRHPFNPERSSRHASKKRQRSEEHTSELQSLMRTSYAVFCLKKTKRTIQTSTTLYHHTQISILH